MRNALRYFPKECHAELGPEFSKELEDFGHIYMYRYGLKLRDLFSIQQAREKEHLTFIQALQNYNQDTAKIEDII